MSSDVIWTSDPSGLPARSRNAPTIGSSTEGTADICAKLTPFGGPLGEGFSTNACRPRGAAAAAGSS
eukprot:CAMPEP_0180304860 /NCGR_PEP_ID=MMETSP0988-20121125/26045_1 /TAXON_ID=697907 /ORGANISM="non described non described, Strain CCMP2293" /LENGTH=66 /DNA_ID=CAMNT_0022287109 /DNA_START=490 /DNA_END=687 /DNA_ORIENTATION=-